MRGERDPQPEMFSYVDLESRIPAKHPIRTIRRIVDEALAFFNRLLEGRIFWKSIALPKIISDIQTIPLD